MQSDISKKSERLIPLCVPEIRGNEWAYIKECLDTGWVSSVGSYVERFEEAIRKYVGVKHAIATVNGTAALHIALLVSGVKPNDEVLIPSLTFIAPANAIRYVGAWPVFIDVEPKHWQIDTNLIEDFLHNKCYRKNHGLYNKVTDRPIKAILPVHLLGHSVDMDPIIELARKFNLIVIEDATEGLGCRYKDYALGSIGDIACFSFNGNKLITTGGGGMIVTNNSSWATKAKYLTTQAKDDPVEYIHNEIGYNYRLTNLQAAMGCAQVENIDKYIEAKRNIAAIYNDALSDIPGVKILHEPLNTFSTFWLYTILIQERLFGMNSRELLKYLASQNIQARPVWQPLHCSPALNGSQKINGKVAEKIYQQALSIPCAVGLTETDQFLVINTIKSIAKKNRFRNE